MVVDQHRPSPDGRLPVASAPETMSSTPPASHTPGPAPGPRDLLLVLGAMFAFSLMALFTRAAAASVLGVAAWRAIFVAIVFAGMAAWREGPTTLAKPSRDTVRLGAMLGVALAIASSTFVGGYAFTTVANTIFLHNLAPVVVFPLAWWMFREKPLPAAVTGAGIALVGVAMLTGVSLFQVAHFANPRFLLGDGLALASALGYGAVLVYTRATRQANTPILSTLALAWTVAAVLLGVVALVAGELWISSSAMLWTLGLALVCTNLPFYLLNLGMKRVGAGLAAVLSLSEVVFATAIGVVVYGEHLAPVGWVGGLLAALGVTYAVTTDDSTTTHAPADTLQPSTLPRRTARLGLALLALNAGAIMALLGEPGSGELLAWAGLATLARLGPAVAVPGLPERMAPALSWLGGLTGAAIVLAAFSRGLPDPGTGNLVLLVAGLVVLFGDRALAAREAPDDTDPHTLHTLGVGLFVAAQAFALLQHGAAPLLATVGLLSLAASGVSTASAGLRGHLNDHRARATFLRLDAPLGRFVTPRRIGAVLAAAWLLGGVHAVPTGHVGIVERFGAPGNPAPAGLAISLPPPIDRLELVDVARIRRTSVVDAGTPLLCGDQSMVTVEASLHYRVKEPLAFAYGVRDPDTSLRSLAQNALLEAVAARTHDDVLTNGRAALEVDVLRATQQAADVAGLGVEVMDAPISTAAVPPSVTAAFLDVISADEERQTAINRAEAYAADVLPRAGGAAVARIAAAHGTAAATVARAESVQAAHTALSTGGARAPALTRERLRWEHLEATLSHRPLVLAPASVSIWLGDTPLPPVAPPR